MQNLRILAPQIIKFGLVGGMNTGIHFLVANILIYFSSITAGLGFALITAIAFIVANTNSYFFNKKWTFKDDQAGREAVKFGTFFLVSIGGFAINISVVYIVTTLFLPFFGVTWALTLLGSGLQVAWANVALLIASACALVWNFLGYKLIVFKK